LSLSRECPYQDREQDQFDHQTPATLHHCLLSRCYLLLLNGSCVNTDPHNQNECEHAAYDEPHIPVLHLPVSAPPCGDGSGRCYAESCSCTFARIDAIW